MPARRRIANDKLAHYEDDIAGASRILQCLERLFHVITLHILDPDVKAAAMQDIEDAADSAEGIKERNWRRMEREKDEAGDE